MVKFVEIFQDLVIKRLNQVYRFAIEFGPKIAFSLIILLIGWISALLLKKIVAKLLKALGFDIVSEKTGLKHFLEKGGFTRSPSAAISLSFYWLIIFSALVMAFNTLELEAASQLVKQAVFYLPKIIVAIIFIALGIFLSKFVGKFVESTSHLARVPMYSILGKAARYLVIGLAIMMALEYLGVATTIIIQYAVIIFGMVPLVLSLIFLIGGKDIVASMLAGRFLLKEYKKGDRIEFESISGEIEQIDIVSTKINVSGGKIIIANAELAKKVTKKLDRGGD